MMNNQIFRNMATNMIERKIEDNFRVWISKLEIEYQEPDAFGTFLDFEAAADVITDDLIPERLSFMGFFTIATGEITLIKRAA